MKKLLGTLLLASTGCVSVRTELQKLPAYGAATKMAHSERPKLLLHETLDENSLPALTPYAVISATGTPAAPKETIIRRIWQEAAKIGADLVVVADMGTVSAGSVSRYLGFGVTLNEPINEKAMRGLCYRVPPANIGFHIDESGMVVSVAPESTLRSAGLLEGDKMISVNGAAYFSGTDALLSGHHLALLTLKPDDEAKLIWIRPGTGRMEGTAKCLPNEPKHLTLPDALEWEAPRKTESFSYSSKGR